MIRVAVIGAGPAGAGAAIHLARLGHGVTLIEARPFPRAKVCGEYISPAATEALESVISPADITSAGGRRVDRFVLEMNDDEVSWTTPKPAWAISRRRLDDRLVAIAREVGVTVRQPATVREVLYADDAATLRLADGTDLCADLVIHADGSGRHDPAGPIALDPGLLGMKCHYRPRGPVYGVRIRAAAGAYIGTIGVEDGEATVALVAGRGLLGAFRGDHDAMLASLWPAWDGDARTTPWMTCGVARSHPVRAGHARSVRLGNAAGAVDPVGGEGIGNAIWSAWMLGEIAAASAPPEWAAALHAAYTERLRVRLPVCRGVAALLMRPRLVAAAWPLLRSRGLGPALMGGWYRLSGKPAV